jgi:uncharacterized membrane protein YeiB
MMLHSPAYISPRCANGGSCGSPVIEVLLLIALGIGLVVGVLGWVQQKWHRGPGEWVLRWLRARYKQAGEPPDPFGK